MCDRRKLPVFVLLLFTETHTWYFVYHYSEWLPKGPIQYQVVFSYPCSLYVISRFYYLFFHLFSEKCETHDVWFVCGVKEILFRCSECENSVFIPVHRIPFVCRTLIVLKRINWEIKVKKTRGYVKGYWGKFEGCIHYLELEHAMSTVHFHGLLLPTFISIA